MLTTSVSSPLSRLLLFHAMAAAKERTMLSSSLSMVSAMNLGVRAVSGWRWWWTYCLPWSPALSSCNGSSEDGDNIVVIVYGVRCHPGYAHC